MAKEKTGKVILENEAKIKKVVIKSHSGEIQFGDLTLKADDTRRLSIWLKDDEPLVITIGGTMQDVEDYTQGEANGIQPPEYIRVAGKLDKITVGTSGDEPKFVRMNFTADQYAKLAVIVKSECLVPVMIEPDTQGLFDMDPDEEEENY